MPPDDVETRFGADGRPLRKLFEVWTSAEGPTAGFLVTVFFHQNPGARETLETLARRLGISEAALRETVADQIAAGMLSEKKADGQTILVYDESRREEVAQLISDVLRSRGTKPPRPRGKQR